MFIIILSIVFVVLVSILSIRFKKMLVKSKDNRSNYDEDEVRKFVNIMKWIKIIGYPILALLLIFSMFTIVSTGTVGIKKTFGVISGNSFDPGLHFIEPWSDVSELSVKTQEYTMVEAQKEGTGEGNDAMHILSSDGLDISVELTILYSVAKKNAVKLVSDVGLDYSNVIIRPTVRSVTRDAGLLLTAEDLYSTKREIFKNHLIKFLEERFAKRGIILEDVLVRGVKLPKTVTDAIENKLKIQQEAQSMVFKLEKEKQEAERKGIEADGIKKFQTIVSEGISDKLLEWKSIEATEAIAKSTNSKIFVFGRKVDGIPMIMDKENK